MTDPNRPGPRLPTTTPPPAEHGRFGGPAVTDTARSGGVAAAGGGRPAGVPASSTLAGSLPAAESSARAVRVGVAHRAPRRARLVIKHIDPWTVMKITFVVSLVILVVIVVATAIIYAVLGKMGVWDQINSMVNSVSTTTASKALHNPLTGSRIIGITAIVGAINVVLMTALATLGAAIYNLISDLVGGVEVTLTDP